MSHFTSITTQIKDPVALAAACKELCLPFVANAISRGYGNQTLKADYVIKCPGRYDIACNKVADGTYEFTTDWWAGDVAKVVGKGYQRLLQLYGVHKTTAAARARGYSVSRETQKNGEIKLQITGC